MTPDRFRECLSLLRWTQRGLAEALQCDDRLVRRWGAGNAEIPVSVAAWLETLGQVHAAAPPPLGWRRPGRETMYDDPLYKEIMRDTKIGDRLTVESTVARWGRGAGHSKRVLDWMVDGQSPATMRRVPGTDPQEWERIA